MIRNALITLIFCITFFSCQKRYHNNDTEKIKEKINYACTLFDNKHERTKALELLMEAFREADNIDNQLLCATALYHYGSFMWLEDQSSYAISVLFCAQDYCPPESHKMLNLIKLGIGSAYTEMGQYEVAERILNESLTLSLDHNYLYGQMMTYQNLGILYDQTKNDNKAIEVNKKGLDIALKLKNKTVEGVFYCNLGGLGSDHAKRIEYLKKAIKIEEETSDKRILCYIYYNLASTYFSETNYENALRSLDKALPYIEFIDKNDLIIRHIYQLYGEIYAAQKDYTAAFNHLTQYYNINHQQESLSNNRLSQYTINIREIEQRCYDYMKFNYLYEIDWNLIIIISISIILISAIYFTWRKQDIVRKLSENMKKLNLTEKRLSEISNEYFKLKLETDEQHAQDVAIIHELQKQNQVLTIYKQTRNSLLEKISEMIREGYKTETGKLSTHLRNINNFITQSFIDNKQTNDIKSIPNDNNDFLNRLQERFPNLAENEKQLCIYFQLGLTTRDIAKLTGKQLNTVTMARYRLRKSLQLSPEEDLYTFLKAI